MNKPGKHFDSRHGRSDSGPRLAGDSGAHRDGSTNGHRPGDRIAASHPGDRLAVTHRRHFMIRVFQYLAEGFVPNEQIV